MKGTQGKDRGGKGRDKGGKGAAKQAPLGPPPGEWVAPSIRQVPPPPTPPQALASAKATGSATSTSAPSQEKQALQQLVQAMEQTKDKLPEALKALLETHQLQESEEEAKFLHKAVSAQQKARKELSKVRTARATYLAGWSTYLGQIQEMLQKQIEDQQKVLGELDEGELQWAAALAEASSSLQNKVGGSTELAGMEGIDAEAFEDAVAVAQDEKVDNQLQLEQALRLQRAQHQASARSLLDAVAAARVKAATEAETAERDRERTPRRKAATATDQAMEVVNIDDEDSKADGQKKPPPGKA